MDFNEFKQVVSNLEHVALPGLQSQLKMSPPYRMELIELQKQLIPQSKKAGVMALFYPNENQVTHLILILRKTYKGVHSAQVGFPGGKVELDDLSLEHTALRETYEEVGVPIEDVNVLKALTEVYIPPSNYTVYPFLGITHKTPKFIKQWDEVEDLIEVSLSDFLNDERQINEFIMNTLNEKVSVPGFYFNQHLVWGATAMMLSEVKDLLKTVL